MASNWLDIGELARRSGVATSGLHFFVTSGTCTGADKAVMAACTATSSSPLAFAVDASLFRVNAGDRHAD